MIHLFLILGGKGALCANISLNNQGSPGFRLLNVLPVISASAAQRCYITDFQKPEWCRYVTFNTSTTMRTTSTMHGLIFQFHKEFFFFFFFLMEQCFRSTSSLATWFRSCRWFYWLTVVGRMGWALYWHFFNWPSSAKKLAIVHIFVCWAHAGPRNKSPLPPVTRGQIL